MTVFESYFTKVYDGTIPSYDYLRRQAENLLEAYISPEAFHFDAELAQRPIDFIETFCKVPSGQIGVPLKLQEFQKARLEAIFGFVDDEDMRQFNEALIVEGRKNGKTTETAALELYMLVADGEGAPQIYNVATAREQAMLGFNAAHKMVKQSDLLKKHIHKRASDLYCPLNMGTIKALSRETSTMDGLDIHMATIDELAAIKNRDIYDLIKQGMGARSQPLLFTISTNGFLRHGIFDAQVAYAKGILNGEMRNKRFISFLYMLERPEDFRKREYWIMANPGLGTIKKEEYLEEMVQKAMDDPSFKPTVMVKDFNIPQTSESSWLRYEDIRNEATWEQSDLKFDYLIGAFDAADSVDLNSARAMFMRPNDDTIYTRSMYWIPETVLEEIGKTGIRRERDNAPYSLWVERGLMRTCPGGKCDKRIFLDWFLELRETEDLYTMFIGYDPWHIDDTLLREFQTEFGKNSMIPVRQGAISLSEPMKEMKVDLQEKKINYNMNPIDEWCLMNTEIKTDVNGNIQPVKKLDQRLRIDGAVSLIIGYKVLKDKLSHYVNMNK